MRVNKIIVFALGVLTGLALLQLKEIEKKPYVEKVKSSKKDHLKISKEIREFSKKTKINLEQTGNYPITIEFKNFNETEDKDDLGFANVDDNNCEIFLNQDTKWTGDLFKLVLYHEIAHCLGLEHNSKSGKVMSEEIGEKSLSREIKNLPLFFKDVESEKKSLLVFNVKNVYLENRVNELIDFLILPVIESKHKFEESPKELTFLP